MTTFTYGQADFSKESTSTVFNLVDMTAANHDAVLASGAALLAAAQGVTRGRTRETILTHNRTRLSNLSAVDTEAQREEKLLVYFEDDVTLRRYSLELGCADITALVRIANSDKVDLADAGVMAAFVAAFEANAVSMVGNAVTIIEAILVGRNI